MSLRSFHIFFIVLAIFTLAGFGYWGLKNAPSQNALLTTGLAIFSLAAAGGLAAYLAWFIRKSKDLPS